MPDLQICNTNIAVPPGKLPTWKIVWLGKHQPKELLLSALQSNGFHLDEQTRNDILKKCRFRYCYERRFELVNVSPGDLGLKGGVTCEQIYDRAREFDLTLIPLEVILKLRLQYADQPRNEWVHVAMKSIVPSTYCATAVLTIGNDPVGRGRYIRTNYSDPIHYSWGSQTRWIFARREKRYARRMIQLFLSLFSPVFG